ncbi:alpha/beta hydrolase [Bradyrhizobium sp. LHD-71]|uniref:alpha/beta hydrolase n=1 Tax=Bradyrhizobium sp. LHD-71 TaxID=3072141 RepID=UPI00280D49FE|nr:alpha/beta hydrolase [Bradyrhizobium sp. LHD-71]MDQ8731626.1 alpha/beta hydrolase [Bradyrhizobium sp. LHD-71]
MTSHLTFIHRFEPGTRLEAPPLLLLHGTGGDENDLLQLGRLISPGSALLSPRGKVLENGMPRYFRRHAEGVFDEDDVRQRAHELADFIEAARTAYGIGKLIAVGYSNGANIAAAILLQRPDVLSSAALLRPMVPLSHAPNVDLSDKRVLMVAGQHDPIIPRENTLRLHDLLSTRGADVESHDLPIGHQLSQADLTLARRWIRTPDSVAMDKAS